MSYVLLLNGRWNQTTGTQWNYSLLDWAQFTNCDLTTHRKRSFWILPCALVLTVTDVTSAEGSNNRLYKTLKLKWGRTPLWTSDGTHSFCRNLKKKEFQACIHQMAVCHCTIALIHSERAPQKSCLQDVAGKMCHQMSRALWGALREGITEDVTIFKCPFILDQCDRYNGCEGTACGKVMLEPADFIVLHTYFEPEW